MTWKIFTLLSTGIFLSAATTSIETHDPVSSLLLSISLLLIGAKLGAELLSYFRQPPVLGELLVGVLLGNLAYFGWHGLEFLRHSAVPDTAAPSSIVAVTIDMFSRIGVILLLFEVGLESNIEQMRRVGGHAFLVAVLGVIAPFGLGWLVSQWLLPSDTWHVHLFIGATLCATSVGITARVLKDLGQASSLESQIILGAAVIDDVLGLIVLAVVQAIIVEGAASVADILLIVSKAVGFLVGAIMLGSWLSPRLFRAAAKLRVHGMLGITGLIFCFLLSWAASKLGLASIVGAFAAGLILDKAHYKEFIERGERSLEEWILPMSTFFVPIFFVMMGFQVHLASFLNPSVLLLALGISIAAIVGKQICSLGMLPPGVDRLSIGIGMIPRGEVGLIFAAIGCGLKIQGQPVLSADIYSALVMMILVTTFITPPLLSWSMKASNLGK